MDARIPRGTVTFRNLMMSRRRSAPVTGASDSSQSKVWQQKFDQYSDLSERGSYTPNLLELYCGMPFHLKRIDCDIAKFIEFQVAKGALADTEYNPVREALRPVQASQDRATLLAVAMLFESVWREQPVIERSLWSHASARLTFYSAAKHCRISLLLAAARGLAYACDEAMPASARLALIEGCLERLMSVGWNLPDIIDDHGPTATRGPPPIADVMMMIASAMKNGSKA
jgi:hypothetical protein